MAKIPLYTSRSAVPQTQQSAVPKLSLPNTAALTGRVFEQVGSRIEQVFTKMNDERIAASVNNASAEAMFQLAQLQTEMENVDPSQVDAVFQQRSGEIYKNLTANMDDASVAKFQTSWVKAFTSTRISNYQSGIKRGRDVMLADDDTAYEKVTDSLTATSKPVDFEHAISQVGTSLDSMVAAGALSASKAAALKDRRINYIRDTQARYALEAGPVKFSTDIDDPNKFEGLNARSRAIFKTQAQNEIERRQREARGEARAISTDAEKNVTNELIIAADRARSGAPLNLKHATEDYIRENVLPERQESLLTLVRDEIDFLTNVAPKISSATNSDLIAMRRAATEQAALNTSNLELDAQNIKQRDLFNKYYNAEIKTRINDTASVAQRDKTVSQKFTNWANSLSNPNAAEGAWGAYKAAIDVEYDRLGIDNANRRYLTLGQAKHYAVQTQGMEPGQAADFVKTIHDNTNTADGGKIFGEIFKKSSVALDIQAMAAVKDHNVRKEIAKIIQGGGVKAVINDPDKVKKLEKEVRTRFNAKFPDMGVSSNLSLTPLRRAALLVAAQKAAGGSNYSEAVREAMDQVAQYQVIDRSTIKGIVYAPNNENVVDASKTQAGLQIWLESQKNLEFDATVTGRIPPSITDEKERQNLARRSLAQTGVWRLSGDGQTATLTDVSGVNSIRDKSGNEIVVPVSEAVQAFTDKYKNRGPAIRPGGYGVLRPPSVRNWGPR